MATDIFYFSGTGNSLKAALDLADKLGDANIISIPSVIEKKEIISNAQQVGIVFPVYIWGVPLMVIKFVQKLATTKRAYIFAIATYGGMPGDTLGQLARLFRSKGLNLSAGFGIAMPGNYTPLYGAIAADKQAAMFEREKRRIGLIASVVRVKRLARIEKNFFLINWIFSGIIYNLSAGKIPKMDRSFWVNDKCTGCRICEKVCPAKNIEMAGKFPRWLGRCEQCMACLQWCPVEAIEYGKSTVGRKRYRNPDISVSNLIKV